MSSTGSDCLFIVKVVQDKFDVSFRYFMGNGSLTSSMYIDSQLLRGNDQKYQSFDEFYEDVLSNDSVSRSNLILGDSGLGKTTLGLHICHKFWKNHAHDRIDLENDRIPIYIHLPSIIKSLQKNILLRFFGKSSSHVDSVAKLKLLLILDGFDELSERNVNIYKTNKWGYPPYRDVRVVILSRHEIPQSHKAGLFEFTQEQEPLPSYSEFSYSEYVIQHFNSEQIDLYIQRFDQFIQSKNENELEGSVWAMTKSEYIKRGWSKAEYLKWFTKFRDLRSLAKTPLILTIIMQTLPKVCRGGQVPSETQTETDILEYIENFCKTKVDVFDGFTESWFHFQYKRLVKAGRLTDFRINWPVFREFCYAFGQNVAYCMISRTRDESRGLLQDHFISEELVDRKFLEVNGNDYSVSQKVKSSCVAILKSSEDIPDLLEAVRIACLIKYSEIELVSNDKTFCVSFNHRSLAEYFVSRDLFRGLAGRFEYFLAGTGIENFSEEESVRGLNSYLLKEEGIILNLADRLKYESDLKNTLLSIIQESKNLSLISIMSANAISILNIAGISLSGLDFSWVQIPGANLNNSICGNTNFNGANLQNVSFENAWLFGAQFKGANLHGTRFGLTQNIPIENVRHIEIRRENENCFLYGGIVCETTGCVKIVKWDLLTLKNVKEYKTTWTKGTTDTSLGFNFWNEKYLCAWWENLILFDLESGEELAEARIPTDPAYEIACEKSECPVHGQILGFTHNGLYMTWGPVLKMFALHLNLDGTKNVLELTLDREYKIEVLPIQPIVKDIINTFSKYEIINIVDFQTDVEFGLVVGYVSFVQFIDKGFRMTFDNLVILAFCIHTHKRQIIIAGPFGVMEVWCIDRKVCLRKLKHSSEFIKTLIFSPDYKYLISGATDNCYGNSIMIWDTERDWSILDNIQIGKDLPISLRIWSTNNGQTILVIPMSESTQLYSINEMEASVDINRMLTQNKMIPQQFEKISCSVDGDFVLTVSRVDRSDEFDKVFESFKWSMCDFQARTLLGRPGVFKTGSDVSKEAAFRIKPYTFQIYSTLTGIKKREIEFPLESYLEVTHLHITFVVNNKILCVFEPKEGTPFFLIYDLEGNILRNRSDMRLPSCGIYSEQLNRDGTLIAYVLVDGQIRLFKLTADEFYIQESGYIQNSSLQSNLKPEFVSFNSSGTCLASVSLYHGLDGTPIFETAQIHIWCIESGSIILRTEFTQNPFSLPIHFVSPDDVFSFDLNPFSTTQEDLSLLAQVNLHNKNINGNISTNTQLLVKDQINMCCIQISMVEDCRPTWSVLWSFCSNLNLVVKELSLGGCISMEQSIFHSLRSLGAHSDGWMASDCQEYISKSNLIYPILGSWDLVHSSILSSEKNECLSPSDDNWILSAIGKKTVVPILNKVAEVKVVSHVFLALEGLKRGRRFIIEAHLYESDSKTYFVLRPVRDLEKFRSENEGSFVKQWYRNRMEGEIFLENVLLDYQSHWEYKFRTQNCVKWCKNKLEKVGIRFVDRIWDKLIISPNAVLGRERVM